ncbi:hypothetical protein ABVN64_02990 [Mycolicibacterium conceptionense]|uniref:hypothetical protein n=1 Tax=Mycolicibacterium conceptionense TaxID=451644 RepID=UPI00336B2EE0
MNERTPVGQRSDALVGLVMTARDNDVPDKFTGHQLVDAVMLRIIQSGRAAEFYRAAVERAVIDINAHIESLSHDDETDELLDIAELFGIIRSTIDVGAFDTVGQVAKAVAAATAHHPLMPRFYAQALVPMVMEADR